MTTSVWDPDQYHRFADQRRRPFDDLVAAISPVPGGRVVDLGCGPGELTVELHRRSGATETLGLDEAETMLDRARSLLESEPVAGVRFARGRIQDLDPAEPFDLVFANASLQWVPDHPVLLARLTDAVAPGGQLAFQVPANHDHVSHTVAAELGSEWGLTTTGGRANVLAPEVYATRLNDLGYPDPDVWMRVYGFEVSSPDELVEWTKGTLLTGYHAQLDDASYARFVAEYRRRLTDRIGTGGGPYYYAFKRILALARRP